MSHRSLVTVSVRSPVRFQIGHSLFSGRGTRKDTEKSFAFYKQSANQNVSEAENSVGIMLEEGVGTIQDIDQAIYWYTRAASRGNADAIFNLGLVRRHNANQLAAAGFDGCSVSLLVCSVAHCFSLSLLRLCSCMSKVKVWRRISRPVWPSLRRLRISAVCKRRCDWNRRKSRAEGLNKRRTNGRSSCIRFFFVSPLLAIVCRSRSTRKIQSTQNSITTFCFWVSVACFSSLLAQLSNAREHVHKE